MGLAYGQNALNFDGIDDYVLTTGNALTGNNPRTIEAWIRTTANTVNNQKVILDWGTMNQGRRFTLNMLQNNSVRLEIGGSGISGNQAINDGQWHHVAAVLDASGQISLYIDGALNTSGSFAQTVNTASANNVTIGVRNDLTNHFQGDIDEVRIWNGARTATQIADHWNRSFCGNPPLSLVAYYRFNQGTPGDTNTTINTLTDYSLNNFTGTLTNFSLAGASSNWVTGASFSNGMVYGSRPVAACERYRSPSGKIIDSSGTYLDTVTFSSTCDSVLTLFVQIDTLDVSVTKSLTTLQANQMGAVYQWLNCDNNYRPVAGATSQSFNPPVPSVYYAVKITRNSCVDTSVCVRLESGMNTPNLNWEKAFRAYPNPSSGLLNLKYPVTPMAIVHVYDHLGQKVHQAIAGKGHCVLELQHLPRGIYSVQLISPQWKFSRSVILQ